MSATLRIGGYDFETSVITCDATVFQPESWHQSDGRMACAALRGGDEGLRDAAPDGRVTLRSRTLPDGRLSVQVSARLPSAIKAVKLALTVPAMKMLAPEEIDLENHTWRQWDFPRDWRTGFAVWQDGGRHFTVITQETPWRFRRLRALRDGTRMRIEIIQDAALRTRTCEFQSSTWELGTCANLDAVLDDYAAFVRQAWGVSDFHRRRDLPAWAREIGLVVNLHGVDWNGRVQLDFAAMTRAVEAVAELFPPAQTLLYPIAWDGRYMRDYPTYAPAAALGGADGFRAFCTRARGLGAHVMPHLNAMAANMRHPLYLGHLKDYVIRDANGIPQHSLKIDWDGDGLGDAAHAYIALEPPALREILVETVDRLIADFGVDAVFLDETCNVFYNDPAWDQVAGLRSLLRDLRGRHPELLIAGEEWNEMLLGLTPLVQIWEETADGRRAFGRYRSPLMRRWAGRFIRACGYLALASPDGHTGVHEWPDQPWVDERENEAFYLPTLAITRHTLERGMPGVQATVARARDYVARFVSSQPDAAPNA